MVSPLSYNARQHNAATKKKFTYALDNSRMKLSYDIEMAIIKICEREILSVK